MNFTRIISNFYQPASNGSMTRQFIYWDKAPASANSFEFDDAFIGDAAKKWVMIFVKGPGEVTSINPQELKKLLTGGAGYNSVILWLDAFDLITNVAYMRRKRFIFLNRNTVFSYNLEPVLDYSNRTQYIISFTGLDNAKVFVTHGSILIKTAAGSTANLSINKGSVVLKEPGISLDTSSREFGSLSIKANLQEAKHIPLASSFLSASLLPEHTTTEPVVAYDVFDPRSFANPFSLEGNYFPFEDIVFSDNSYTSNFKVTNHEDHDLVSNFIDEQGRQFVANDLSSLKFNFSKISIIENNRGHDRYVLRPLGTMKLAVKDSANHMLVGFSGTEAIGITKGANESSIELEFTDSDKVLVDEKKNELRKHFSGNRTTLIKLKEDKNYFLDSERAPQFENLVNGFETPYKHRNNANLPADESIPMIPTLGFRTNKALLEMEKVFTRIRLGQRTGALTSFDQDDKEYMTPQGFKVKGDTYDFMLPNESKNYRFRVGKVDVDFNVSITKEDVFFVTTPKLLRQAGNSVKYDIRFGLSDFVLDLNKIPGDADHSQYIVIFKYSKKPFKELLNDVTKWSNYGKYENPIEIPIAKKTINDYINSFPQGDEDYAYFNKTILTDANWNGVVILNVPLGDLPVMFKGLTASQNLKENERDENKLSLKTTLRFQYMALPVNKTGMQNGLTKIISSSFFGLIDYDLVKGGGKGEDYAAVKSFFTTDPKFKFVLTKLLVRFENSQMRRFQSFVFLLLPELFQNKVDRFGAKLTHNFPGDDTGLNEKIDKLVRLRGVYQKNEAGEEEFIFDLDTKINVVFEDGNVLQALTFSRASFSYSKGKENEFRFDFDADVQFKEDIDLFKKLIKFDKLKFQNIGLKFKLGIGLPDIHFDVSRLLPIPTINFNGDGFLSSFPIRFSSFKAFTIFKGLKIPEFDFLNIFGMDGTLTDEDYDRGVSLWSMIFDFDLGTLGDLSFLKNLKGKLLVGWFKKGGLRIALKLDGPSSDGLHVDLFGALKLDITEIKFGQFKPLGSEECSAYFLRLLDARLTIFGTKLPKKECTFNGMIIADFSSKKSKKIAWLINLDDNEQDLLLLGVGQRVGPPTSAETTTEAIKLSRDTFKIDLAKIKPCDTLNFYDIINFRPERNWLVASEDVLALFAKDWSNVVLLKFIFNDPILYGIYLGIRGEDTGVFKGFAIDILYRKLSENLGVWSTDIRLPDHIRNQEFGGGSITFPNFGLQIFTNGDWKVNIGYPRTSDDWSRSCLIQIRPFVGWAGFYLSRLRTVALTLFGPYMRQFPEELSNCNIIQTGFAFRIGIGAYIDKGIFYAGASLSVYGILEGAFAFKKGQNGLAKFFPDHFALRGRVGAIAEIVGYVDFKIIKASVHVILRVEFGMLLVVIKGHGLQPVPVYIEGRVSVRVSVTIACFRIFRKKICIVLHFSFAATIRFEYTIGGAGSQGFIGFDAIQPFSISVPIRRIPVVYIPAVTWGKESYDENASLYFIHSFALPFFGVEKSGDNIKFSARNILKDDIILPLFNALITELQVKGIKANYENLRTVLLRGEIQNGEVAVPVKLTFPEYRPLFISGKDLNTDKELLKTAFHFTEEEAKRFLEVNADKCTVANKVDCPFRLLQIPVSHAIDVQSLQVNGGAPLEFINGFKILVENLATSADGNSQLALEIKEDRSYTESEIKKIETYFDAFKTQFVDRKASDAAGFEGFDLRTDFVIPEYFKLIGLLVLEAYAGTHDKPEDRKQLYDPALELNAAMIAEDGRVGWVLNNNLESITGQLNYFFNHGLRLPDKGEDAKDLAWFSFLGQSTKVTGASTAATANIRIVKADDETVSVSLLKDIFSNDAEVSEFKNYLEVIKKLDLNTLGNGFATAELIPYEKVAVVLSVPNSSLQTSDKKQRYYSMPARLRAEAARLKFNESYSCAVKLSNTDNNDSEVVKASVCANIEIKVKPYKKDNKVRVLEIVNVYIDDLDLMNLVKNDHGFVDRISMYLEKGDDANSQLVSMINSDLGIVKTNLSPKTHPPVIVEDSLGFDVADEFVAGIKHKSEFIKLVWEGLTTNNGGYYFMLDGDQAKHFPDEGKQYSVVLSLETTQPVFPGFCNAINIQDQNSLFAKLDEGTHFLCIDKLKVNGEDVKEYHARIPSHCFGFEISRQQLSEALSQYLPVEFSVKQHSEVKSNDRTLPLMPQGENKLLYKHIIPTVAMQTKENLGRYDSINKTTSIDFGFRDIYGFKALKLNKPLKHVHKYFDKLLPLSSWPFISFNYDFVSYSADNKRTKWKLTAALDKSNTADLLQTTEDRDRILETLYTAKAQVNDQKCAIFISHGEMNLDRKKLTDVIDQAINIAKGNAPGENSFDITFFEIAESPETPLRTPINTQVVFKRKKDDCIKIEEKLWEKDSISSISNEIDLIHVSKEHNPLQELNNKLKRTPFVLGVSSDATGRRIYHLVNKKEIASVAPQEQNPLPLSTYYGIKPYSNKLWSGTYSFQDAQHKFTDVDLDSSLRIILSQMDKQISANNLLEITTAATIAAFRTLLRSKRSLVKEELSIRTDNVNKEMDDASQQLLRRELSDLVLNKLDSFYEFDGIIKICLNAKPMLAGHRLTLSFDKLDDYNLVSSKIDYISGKPEWIILFDRINNDRINFKCNAFVTHLEYNIATVGSFEEIQSSSWIQLVEPVKLEKAVEVKDWPQITRVFPAKPMITLNDAVQTYADGDAASANWNRNLGEWNYLLSLEDEGRYVTGDIIEVVLRTKMPIITSGFEEVRNFKGFIAYWSAQIADTSEVFNWVDFATDLEKQLKLTVPPESGEGFEGADSISFELHKTAPNKWEPKVPVGSKIPLQAITLPQAAKPSVVVSAFSLFEDATKLQVLSVQPEVRVLRNRNVENKAFHYATQKVSPADWATPHIRYWKKIVCANRLQSVYDTIPVSLLPYKSTAKYLVKMGTDIPSSPVIPVQQMEYDKQKPANIDALFTKYRNGTPAVAITMYHTDPGVDLPVFFADTIMLKT